jgi:hypothetical protein
MDQNISSRTQRRGDCCIATGAPSSGPERVDTVEKGSWGWHRLQQREKDSPIIGWGATTILQLREWEIGTGFSPLTSHLYEDRLFRQYRSTAASPPAFAGSNPCPQYLRFRPRRGWMTQCTVVHQMPPVPKKRVEIVVWAEAAAASPQRSTRASCCNRFDLERGGSGLERAQVKCSAKDRRVGVDHYGNPCDRRCSLFLNLKPFPTNEGS